MLFTTRQLDTNEYLVTCAVSRHCRHEEVLELDNADQTTVWAEHALREHPELFGEVVA